MNEHKHTLGQAWLQRTKELVQERADSSFAYGELPSDVGETESADAYARSLAADRSLDAHLQPMAHLIDALHLAVGVPLSLMPGIRRPAPLHGHPTRHAGRRADP